MGACNVQLSCNQGTCGTAQGRASRSDICPMHDCPLKTLEERHTVTLKVTELAVSLQVFWAKMYASASLAQTLPLSKVPSPTAVVAFRRASDGPANHEYKC